MPDLERCRMFEESFIAISKPVIIAFSKFFWLRLFIFWVRCPPVALPL